MDLSQVAVVLSALAMLITSVGGAFGVRYLRQHNRNTDNNELIDRYKALNSAVIAQATYFETELRACRAESAALEARSVADQSRLVALEHSDAEKGQRITSLDGEIAYLKGEIAHLRRLLGPAASP